MLYWLFESVLLSVWYPHLAAMSANQALSASFWEEMLQVRAVVNKEIENQRNAGNVGSGLAADITLYANPHYQALLAHVGEELRFITITSSAVVEPFEEKPAAVLVSELPGLAVQVLAAEAPKCVRCWHRQADIGAHAEHPELCGRCVTNVSGAGERRQFA